MTTEKLLLMLEQRGLKPVGRDGKAALVGPKEMATPQLMAVIKLHRKDLLKHLGLPPDTPEVEEQKKEEALAELDLERRVQEALPLLRTPYDWSSLEALELRKQWYAQHTSIHHVDTSRA